MVYSQTIKLKPDFAYAYCWRGSAYSAKGDYDKAIADLNQAIRLKPDFEEAKEALEEARKAKEAR